MSRRFQPLVLCYHAVSDSWPNMLAVTPRAFELQLRTLLRRGFRPVQASETLRGVGRLLHVTFDDAYRSVANAVPILERLEVHATVFACSAYANTGRPLDVPEIAADLDRYGDELATMDWEMLRALAERGVEIGSHTVSHPHLTHLSDAELVRELRDSRDQIEAELPGPCRFLAYPYGELDARVRVAAQAAGYEGAFALHRTEMERPFDRHALPRVELNGRDGPLRAALKTSFVRRRGRMLLRVVKGANTTALGASP
jgi:peptidoglycan/xylan/chitin deacetylase (PgdA/CDA1 family)